MSDPGKFSILVVDDIDFNIDLLVDILGDDYDVRVASDGQTALDVIALELPDLILLDIMMPGMDGYEVCRRLKFNEITREIPVIFLTAKTEIKDEIKGFELGAVDYITKPVSPPIVRARVANHLSLKQARQELKDQNAVLKENVRLREDVDRISRHDLKTPLGKIISLSQILLMDKITPPGHGDHLRSIEKSGYTMLEMINRSLDLFKMERGTYALNPEPVDLLDLVRKIAFDLHWQTSAKKASFRITVHGRPQERQDAFFVSGERLLCYSMAANLIKNALEACPDKTVVHIDLAAIDTQWARIKIHNQGMVPETIQNSFLKKYTTAGKTGGTGLGTYSAWLMANTLGGSIEMETHPVQGTSIRVVLPQTQQDIQKQTTPVRDNPETSSFKDRRFPGQSLLIVDDDPDNAALLSTFLNHPDLTIDTADNGQKAIEKWRTNRFDLILMDLEMPVMGGMEAVRRIRLVESKTGAFEKRVTIFALSAHSEDIESACMEAGFNGYLSKPVAAADLYGIIGNLVSTGIPGNAVKGFRRRKGNAPGPSADGSRVVEVDRDLEEIIPTFLSNKKKQIQQAIAMAESDDFQELRQISHKMKGGFNIYRITGLGDICGDLERAAEDRNPGRVRLIAKILMTEFENLKIVYS